MPNLEELWNHNLEYETEPTIEISRAGALFRARYAGQRNSTFGSSPIEAARKLRFFNLGTRATAKVHDGGHNERI